MIPEIIHEMDGQERGEPRDWQNLEITVDWKNKKESGTVNVSDLSFTLGANQYIQQHVKKGVEGGVGIFEGIPYKIKVGEQMNPTYIFKGYLDLTDEMTVFGQEEITVSLKKEQGEDWLTDVADSFSFAYLHNQGLITNSDFIKVPYVINYVPDSMQMIILSMSIYLMTKEIVENIQYIAESVALITNASTPIPVASVPPGLGWDVGDFIMATIKVIARIAYTIAIVIAIKNLITQLFEQLMPKKRYHLGMSFYRMFEVSCQYLNLTLSSNLLENIKNEVHIPPKDRKGGDAGETGFPSTSSAIYTFGDLIRVMKERHNADYRIQDGIFYFERRDSFDTPSIYQMPDYFEDQDRLLDKFKYNTSEMVSNYNITYEYDTQDQNTLDDQSGRLFQAITTPVVKDNPKLVVIKNLAQISVPFSLGKEKKSLTDVEKTLRSLGQVVDTITGIFGGGTNFSGKIEDRIGSLLLSSHFLTFGKVVVMQGGRLAPNQRELLNALNLWNDYHYINSFATYKGVHNQYVLREEVPVPMSIEDFDLLLTNNKATNSKGDEYRIDKVVYRPYKGTAKIDYGVKKIYTNNLKVEIV